MIVAVLCGLALSAPSAQLCSAQASSRQTRGASTTRQAASASHAQKTNWPLSPDDGLAVISAALDSKVRRDSAHDCSHLVHAIYERAGFPYPYADSDDLYAGVSGFLRVKHPQPGDLVVWRGHTGIVVRPSRHVFFSFLSAGPGIDNYETPYWVGRGHPRFYRYIKNDPCRGCNASSAALQPSPRAK